MKVVIAFLLSCGMQVAAQDMQSCPMHKEHMKNSSQHQADVEQHGDQAMGFPHDKTTHHFLLYRDGGAIEVTANDGKDSTNIQSIRTHLAHIVTMFSSGDFSAPMFVHDQVPPGIPVMKEKRNDISYTVEEVSAGARVRIKTTNDEALKAVHDFLCFQIEDHHTGDVKDISATVAVCCGRSGWGAAAVIPARQRAATSPRIEQTTENTRNTSPGDRNRLRVRFLRNRSSG